MGIAQGEEKEAIELLKKSVLVKYCTDAQLQQLAKRLQKRNLKMGQYLAKEGDPQEKMFLIAAGEVVREKADEGGQLHRIDTYLSGNTVGSLHLMNNDPAYASSKCITDVVGSFSPSILFRCVLLHILLLLSYYSCHIVCVLYHL